MALGLQSGQASLGLRTAAAARSTSRGDTFNLKVPSMARLGFVFFGLIVGLIARTLTPGDQPMGWFSTALLGVTGSVLGGFVSAAISRGHWNEPHAAGWLGSVVGTIILLAIASSARRRNATGS